MEYKIRLTRSLSIKPLWLMPFLQQFYVICRTFTCTNIKHIK